MNYKVFIFRDRKLQTVREFKTAMVALNHYKTWYKELETTPDYYTIDHIYYMLFYYKNKRIKTKKIDKRS